MPADGVVMETPATCGPATDTVLPIRCGVTREFGRRAAATFSLDLTVVTVEDEEAESMDKWVELVDDRDGPLDEWVEPASVPATTNTTLPSDGTNFGSLLVVVVATAAAAAVVALVESPMPQ